mmetsp:Transcript_5911/g.23945  ORF Transcript_5911/g.23945 Transcript_5911/m.23945 type:complete len:326 (+) Transcript_5911:1133-2110(+)
MSASFRSFPIESRSLSRASRYVQRHGRRLGGGGQAWRRRGDEGGGDPEGAGVSVRGGAQDEFVRGRVRGGALVLHARRGARAGIEVRGAVRGAARVHGGERGRVRGVHQGARRERGEGGVPNQGVGVGVVAESGVARVDIIIVHSSIKGRATRAENALRLSPHAPRFISAMSSPAVFAAPAGSCSGVNSGGGGGETSTSLPFLSSSRTKGTNSMPIMNGRSAGGTTNPSGVCQFSIRQHSERSVAVSVELSRCTYAFFFSGPFEGAPHRISSRRDWKSVQLEHDTSSRNVLLEGNHASRSYFFAAASLSSPETMFTTWYGMPRLW